MNRRVSGVTVSKFLVALFWIVAWSIPSAHAQSAGNAERGAKLAYTCLGCHGIPNYRNPSPNYRVPKLRGQHPEYLVLALQAYQSGERSHATMHANASGWKDQDLADMAAFLAGPPVTPAAGSKPVGQAPDVAQTCVACHGVDGIGITPQYPTLAGQHADYLERALTDYKRGGRKNAIMGGFAGALSAADIRALAAYYAAQRPGLDTSKRPAPAKR
ncbi:MAG: c-type cytochrome [Gammaproteobacteria bacterium]|nr:c-type cytochrome [Gammaproteobacteria bacterium]